MVHEEEVRKALTNLEEIHDGHLRDMVVQVWTTAMNEGGYESLDEIPWIPEIEGVADGIGQMDHQSDVTAMAVELVDTVISRNSDLEIDRDLVIAGALLHDISKLVERSEEFKIRQTDELVGNQYLPHPHYGVHLVADAGLPPHLQHIVLAHTDASSVDPLTIEAELVKTADEIAASTLLWKSDNTLLHLV